jgi:uncharacterized protein (TIGR03435 family)
MRIHLSAAGPERKLILKAVFAVALTGAACAPLWSAQTPTVDWQTAAGGKMVFDVASVTRNTTAPSPGAVGSNFPLGPGDVYNPNGGRFGAVNFPLIVYLEFAYKISDNQEQFLLPQLPEWVMTTRFDIHASAQGNPTKDQMRLMMQSLLADHFKLSVHYETRQVPVFALLVDLPGNMQTTRPAQRHFGAPHLRPRHKRSTAGFRAPVEAFWVWIRALRVACVWARATCQWN